MSRPAYVLDVDSHAPAFPVWRNTTLDEIHLPTGSRVVYAPEPQQAIVDLKTAVDHALQHPLDGEPLPARLRSGMCLTISFDELTATDRPISGIDPRAVVIEAVLDMVANAGVDDVQLVGARGLARRMTKNELAAMLGDRVTDSFVVTDLLTQHDADSDDLVKLKTKTEHPVSVNARVAQSDLLIHVALDTEQQASHENLARRLTDATTARSVSLAELGTAGLAVDSHTDVFQIAIELDNRQFAGTPAFLQYRRPEWSMPAKGAFELLRGLTTLAPDAAARLLVPKHAPRATRSIVAGSVTATHRAALQNHHEQHGVDVDDQSDVVVVGTAPASPFAVHSSLNPLLALREALRAAAPTNTTSFVRPNGAVIIVAPQHATFDAQHQPSFIDFFEQVLPARDDSVKQRESSFAEDAWFSHLYQSSYAHHGLLPFRIWGECEQIRSHLGTVITVGGSAADAHRLGLRRASSFSDALEMAAESTGQPHPSVTHLAYPYARLRAKA